jgi:uncharacterized protein (UPF0332 family)
MNIERITIARYRLEKARKTLAFAESSDFSNSLESLVNRIYYAMFYSVSALLVIRNLTTAKHSGVLAYLNREFVMPGFVSVEHGRFYADMFDRRQRGDYKDFVSFEKDDVIQWLGQAKGFIQTIETLAEKLIANADK